MYLHTYSYETDGAYIYYLYYSKSPVPVRELQNLVNNPDIIGLIRYVIRDDDDEGTITHMSVIPEYRGHGFAKRLLREAVKRMSKVGIQIIELDDTSDRSRRGNNIYVNFGFKYVDESGPE